MKVTSIEESPPMYSELVERTVKRLWATKSRGSNLKTNTHPLGDYEVSIYALFIRTGMRYSIHLFFDPTTQPIPHTNAIGLITLGELIFVSDNRLDIKATLYSLVNDLL